MQRIPSTLNSTVAQMIVTSAPGHLTLRIWENWYNLSSTTAPTSAPVRRMQAQPQIPPESPVQMQRASSSPPVRAVLSQTFTPLQEQAQLPSAAQLLSTNATPSDFDFSKAVKVDDAQIPAFFWDNRVWQLGFHDAAQKERFVNRYADCPLSALRSFFLRIWRRRIRTSLIAYLKQSYGVEWATTLKASKERNVGRECIWRSVGADWWEWREGSTLMFWRWPKYARKMALEGHKPWFRSPPTARRTPQREEKDAAMRERIQVKLEVPLKRRYIVPGHVSTLTNYFAVPKGETDLRMVYDASKSGLNDCL
jgi:hypothetical protein